MKNQPNQWKLSGLMALLVFFLFALCLLLVVLTGARVYRTTVQSGQAHFEYRTPAQYLTTKIRQSDCLEQLTVESFCGADALVFREEIQGEAYRTLVYCHDGWLRELFCTESGTFTPEDGQAILPLQRLTLQLNNGLLSAYMVSSDGTCIPLVVTLRSGREVLP